MDNGIQSQDHLEEARVEDGFDSTPHPTDSHLKSNARPTHQRLVFTDPAAFRYLEEDPSTIVLERRRRLQGYELYIVEQWACSRNHPTFVITTYTGLDQHSVIVGVLSVPTDEQAWSPRLRVYLKAITKYHARAKETPLGTLMVTNLSGFPSALTVIAIPDGDLKNHRESFIVNEDLKRLGCSGRAGMNLAPPTGATQAKFRELYHTSDQIPITGAVVELVKLCQAALMLFGKLALEYADGLLCDVTEQSVSDWWADIGSDYFHIDPADGILGPTTVGAMLGLLMGARNRLNSFGAPVAKDVFDILHTKRAISYFQKSQKMERTRRLDRKTLDRLHKVTAKAASNDGWAVPRVVKSTVAELSGKGGEMVNGRVKAGIAEIETIDIDDFIRLGSGGRFKWLWHGKPRKHDHGDALSILGDGLIFKDEHREGKQRASTEDESSLRHTLSNHLSLPSHNSQTSLDHDVSDQALRRAVLKNMTGKVTDPRSGFGKIRDKVSRRHQHKYSKETNAMLDDDSVKDQTPRESLENHRPRPSDTSQAGKLFRRSGHRSGPDSQESSRRGSRVRDNDHPSKMMKNNMFYTNASIESYDLSSSSLDTPAINSDTKPKVEYMDLIDHANGITSRPRAHPPKKHSKASALSFGETQAIDKMEHFKWTSSRLTGLRTTKSFSDIIQTNGFNYWEQRFPRQMSFSALTEVVFNTVSKKKSQDTEVPGDPDPVLANERVLILQTQLLERKLNCLDKLETSWVQNRVAQIEGFDQQCGRTQSQMDEIYRQKHGENQEMQAMFEGLMAQKKSSLTDAIKDVETLDAKLEYELQALQSKVEDVENGVDELERHILLVEAKAAELDERNEQRVSWFRWLLGFGIF